MTLKMNLDGTPMSETNRSKAIACQLRRKVGHLPGYKSLKFLETEKHMEENTNWSHTALVIITLNERECHKIRHDEGPPRPLYHQLVNVSVPI